MSSQLFKSLHQGPGILLLANAWDAGSARLIESSGAKAIATTSAGLAWSRGFADGNLLPEDKLIDAIADIARVTSVPLTVDFEAGYSDDPRRVAKLVARVLAVGVAGINIEDGGGSPDLLCRKIAAIREQAAHAGGDLYINARTDVYLRGIATGEAATEETIRRGSLYRAAGCDGLFVPGLANIDAIGAITAAVKSTPLNIMAVPNLPSIDALQKHGVRRLSAGSAIAQAALGCAGRHARGFLAGNVDDMFLEAAEYGVMNKLFASAARE